MVMLLASGPEAPTPPKAPVVPLVAAPAPVPVLPEVMPEVPPPPLTRKALCGELTRTSKELANARAKVEADRKALDGERRELEKLKAEIVQARAGLRTETDRLEALLAKRDDAPPPPAERPAPKVTASRPQELDALARTMKSMKPEAAAALVQRSEPNLAAALLKRMKPADAGAVMDRLKPELAADLMALMSTMPSTPPKAAGGRL